MVVILLKLIDFVCVYLFVGRNFVVMLVLSVCVCIGCRYVLVYSFWFLFDSMKLSIFLLFVLCGVFFMRFIMYGIVIVFFFGIMNLMFVLFLYFV